MHTSIEYLLNVSRAAVQSQGKRRLLEEIKIDFASATQLWEELARVRGSINPCTFQGSAIVFD